MIGSVRTLALPFQLPKCPQIKRQCRIRASALLLSSVDQNSTFCQVCGGQLLEKPIQCVRAKHQRIKTVQSLQIQGDADFLSILLRAGAQQIDGLSHAEKETIGQDAPVLARVEQLEEVGHLEEKVHFIGAKMIGLE